MMPMTKDKRMLSCSFKILMTSSSVTQKNNCIHWFTCIYILWLDLHFFNKIICHSKTFSILEFRWSITLLHFLLSFGRHSFQCGNQYRNTSNPARGGGLWDKRWQGNSHQTMNHLHVSTHRYDKVTGCDKILFHF